MNITYDVLDPTGNLTILVETPVPIALQPAAAAQLMALEPGSEQVGFLSEGEDVDRALRMAGGEFCGNASMSAALICALDAGKKEETVRLRVSGAEEVVCAQVSEQEDGAWRGTVDMPRPAALRRVPLEEGGELPCVRFDGITHVILETPMPKAEAERLAVRWCRALGADALGLMFLDREQESLTPLVYVPAANTLCWETSCASGTTAVGAFLAAESGAPLGLNLKQPGGSLRVDVLSDGRLRLTGNICLLKRDSAEISVEGAV